MTDAISALIEQEAVYACEVEGIWHDVGDHLGYVKATIALAAKCPDLRDKLKKLLREWL